MTESGTTTAQLFRVRLNLIRYSAGSKEQLIYCPVSRVARTLPNLTVQILGRCRNFATLDQHAAQVCNEMGFDHWHRAATKKILVDLAEAGLLVSREAYTSSFLGSSQEEKKASISSLGIPTCNRPQLLERSLRSYAACSQLYGRQIRFMVADQTEDEALSQANVQTIAALQKELGIEVMYAGLAEKNDFVERLAAKSGIAVDVVRFALLNDENCPIATGANRNALLLSSLDELTLQVDDDTICLLSPSPELSSGLAFVTQYSVMERWFPGQEESEALGHDFQAENVFSLHEQLLGKSLASCISEVGNGQPDLENIAPSFFAKAQRNGGKVLVTALGLAGDSGAGTNHYYLALDGKERSRLISTEDNYRQTMSKATVISAVPRATISNDAYCPTLNIGLDNRQLLPPFMPVQRSQDCVFSLLVHSCSPSGYTGFLPWAILHKRKTPWMMTKDQMRQRVAHRFTGDLITMLVRQLAPKPGFDQTTKNLMVLGKSLREWGCVPLADFEEMLRLIMLDAMCADIAMLDGMLERHGGQPVYWADDVNLWRSSLREAVTKTDIVVAGDLQAAFGTEYARTLMQRLVRRFGELLEHWSSLRQAATDLRAQGYQLGRKV